MAAADIVGGALIVDLRGGSKRVVNLDECEAYDLMAYARARQLAERAKDTRRMAAPTSLRKRDALVWELRQKGACVPEIAHALGISQASVAGSLRRVAAGRYEEIGGM